jgi:hypothetical protein
MNTITAIPTAVTIPEGFTVRVIDNYAGDHDAAVKPGTYALTHEHRMERAEWTASGEDEKHFTHAFAALTIFEEERTVSTVLYFGKTLATKIEPAHEATKFFRIDSYNLNRLAVIWPTLTFHYGA